MTPSPYTTKFETNLGGWVLRVMDQYTRHIICFGVHAEDLDGPSLCVLVQTRLFGIICDGRPIVMDGLNSLWPSELSIRNRQLKKRGPTDKSEAPKTL